MQLMPSTHATSVNMARSSTYTTCCGGVCETSSAIWYISLSGLRKWTKDETIKASTKSVMANFLTRYSVNSRPSLLTTTILRLYRALRSVTSLIISGYGVDREYM